MWIAIGVVLALLAMFLVLVSLQPSNFTLARSTTIAAGPDALFPLINDLPSMYAWSPWKDMDPQAKVEYSQPSNGAGAWQRWSGNNQVGEGSLTINESHPHERVNYTLRFVRPFKCENQVVLALEPQDDQTKVTWSMSGRNNFVAKAMCLFINMEKMVGKDFEKGLARLKQTVELS